jgi:hypothetical protein
MTDEEKKVLLILRGWEKLPDSHHWFNYKKAWADAKPWDRNFVYVTLDRAFEIEINYNK